MINLTEGDIYEENNFSSFNPYIYDDYLFGHGLAARAAFSR